MPTALVTHWLFSSIMHHCKCALLLALTILSLSPCAVAAPDRSNQPLRVAIDDNYPPYIFRNEEGQPQGYLVDLWALWEQQTGVTVELLASDWDLAQERMKTQQADVIDTVFITPERLKSLDFSPPYAKIPVAIYTHHSIGGIAKLEDLRGFLVGVKAGDACVEPLKQAGLSTLQYFPNYEALVQGAIDDRVRILCLDEPPANYLFYKHNAESTFNRALRLEGGEFHRAVHKGEAATLALVNRGFAAIDDPTIQVLVNKWMGNRLSQPSYARHLTYVLPAIALLAALLLLWGATLRHQVRQRTAELNAERNQLRLLIETIPDLVWMKDNSGVFRYCNPQFERLFNTPEAQIVGKTDYDFVDSQRAASFRAHDQQAVKTDSPYVYEEWLTFADNGQRMLVETTKTPVRSPDGRLNGVLGIARDITGRKLAEQALQVSEHRLHTILDSVDAFIYIKDRDYRYQYANRRVCELFGRSMEEIVGHDDSHFFDADTAANLRQNDSRVIDQGERVEAEEVNTNLRDQITSAYHSVKMPLRDQQGQIYALCGISTDITARKQAETSLRIAAAAFEAQQGTLISDANNRILRVNQAFLEMSGYSEAEVIGQDPRMFASGRHDQAFYTTMWDEIINHGSWQGEIWDRRKDGQVYPKWLSITAVKNGQGQVVNYVATQSDITERKSAEAQIRNLAFFDPLTQLPNRRLLADRLQHALASSARSRREGALLFIDLDHFKILNDTLGHDKGDLLLQEVARRISACVREGDTVARLGGDEFVVMLEGLSQHEREAAAQAESVGMKILAAIDQPFDLDGLNYATSSSIGITLFVATENGSEELMKRADLAMYQAKAAGRNALRFFDPAMQAELSARTALEADLRNALQQQQLVLHYQPQFDAQEQITGVEALVRWQHPEHGLVPPNAFIPLAEESGLIIPLGSWVLETACQQLAQWASDPVTASLSIAVNLSAGQLHQKNFVAQVQALIERSGVNPQRLKLELTESQLLNDIEECIAKMNRLRALGLGFSLDDFGTGYSSLAYLKRLPLEQLKIDRSFVRDVLTNPNDAAIARTVVALAHSLGLAVIAEGVETEAQRTFLAAEGCLAYQGFLYSRPLPIEELDPFIRRHPVKRIA